jgi:Ser/Thr protein kinase RdoA (MazF antagonist)
MNHCGKWLRLFQEFSGLELVEFDRNIFDIVIHRAEYRLKLIEESRLPACPKNFRSRVMAFLEEQLDQLSGKNILISGRHGDFNPLNILVGPEGITVIDFFGYQKDPVPIDILKILVCLDDEMRAVTSSKKRVTEMRKAFLDGYGELPHIQEPVLLLSEALHRIVSLWGNISNEKQRFHHRVEANLRIQAHVDWLTSEPNLTLLY